MVACGQGGAAACRDPPNPEKYQLNMQQTSTKLSEEAASTHYMVVPNVVGYYSAAAEAPVSRPT